MSDLYYTAPLRKRVYKEIQQKRMTVATKVLLRHNFK
jgi:hypothetical protein